MHKGKIYPYAPAYWTTEGWFWKGYMPWRLKIRMDDPGPSSPWSSVPTGVTFLPPPIGYVPDYTQCFWYVDRHSVPMSCNLRVSAEVTIHSDVKYCTWLFKLVDDSGSGVAIAHLFLPFPQYVVATSGQTTIEDDPSVLPDGPSFAVAPATYAEGGSPWS